MRVFGVWFFVVLLLCGVVRAEAEVAGEVDVKPEEVLKVLSDDIVIGDDGAPITIVEYASMTCSHCASFHNKTFGELKEKYITTGKVKFIFRDFPLDEPALRAAMMARCAGRDGGAENFEKFIKVMFSTQSNWAPKSNYKEILSNLGKLGGMAGDVFDQCMADTELEKYVMQTKYVASKSLAVRSTPTLFINGVMHKGAKDIDYLKGVLDELLVESDG